MRIGTFEIESPLMNAGGVVKTPLEADQMAATGVGAVLAGSYTLEPRIGNSPNGERVYYHDAETGITYNSLGMPNSGVDMLATVLSMMQKRVHSREKPLVINLAPVSDKPADETREMLSRLSSGGNYYVDAVELNASCPNVVTADGGRHELLSHHPDDLAEVLAVLTDESRPIDIGSVWVRISPFHERHDALQLVEVVHELGVDAVSAFNTFPGGKPLRDGEPALEVPGNVGGMSGPGMSAEAEEQMRWLMDARSAYGASFDIIGSNGISDVRSMRRRLNMGASMVSATTLFYESTDWGGSVHEILEDFSLHDQ